MSKKCVYCGAELEDDAIFCDECGKKQELVKKSEQKAPKEAEPKAKQEADAIAEAAQKVKEEAEEQVQEAAEAKLEAEGQTQTEEEAQKEKENSIRAESQIKFEKKAAEEAGTKHSEKEHKKEVPTYKAYASLILGILTWVTLPTGFVPLITIPVGVFFGAQALKSEKKKTAFAGLVLNGIIVALIIAVIIA